MLVGPARIWGPSQTRVRAWRGPPGIAGSGARSRRGITTLAAGFAEGYLDAH